MRPLIRTAIAHVEFEALHPFEDGNGRIGQMLITLMLWKLGVLHQAVSEIASTLGGAMGVTDTVGRARLDAEMIEWGVGTQSELHCILMWQSHDLTKAAL